MLGLGSSCFLQVVTPSGQKILKVGKVVQRDAQRIEVHFEELVRPHLEQSVLLFAEQNRRFYQQLAVVCGLRLDLTPPGYAFELQGEPISAEQRGSYRVSTVTAHLIGRLGKGKCALADVSPEGIGTISTQQLKIGQRIEVELDADGTTVYGLLSVQTVKQLSPTKFRYGLYAPEPKSVMRRSLERLTNTMQRYQLKRISGAA